MMSNLYCELSKICSASLMRRHNQKTSLAKYSIEFNYFAVQMRPYRIAYLKLLDLTHYCMWEGQTAATWKQNISELFFSIASGTNYASLQQKLQCSCVSPRCCRQMFCARNIFIYRLMYKKEKKISCYDFFFLCKYK